MSYINNLNLKQDLNYRHIAAINRKRRLDPQPCYDDRFLPANVNWELYAEVLQEKHNRLTGNKSEKGYYSDYKKKPKKELSLWKFVISEVKTTLKGIFNGQ